MVVWLSHNFRIQFLCYNNFRVILVLQRNAIYYFKYNYYFFSIITVSHMEVVAKVVHFFGTLSVYIYMCKIYSFFTFFFLKKI